MTHFYNSHYTERLQNSRQANQPIRQGIRAIILMILLVLTIPGYCEDLRIGLVQNSTIEIRCDGPVEVVSDQNPSNRIEIPAGIYTARVVENRNFYRPAPLVSGIISSPMTTLVAVTAGAENPSASWYVILVETKNEEGSQRAVRDAQAKIGGKIDRLTSGDKFIVRIGPYPNIYLARQALEKAKRANFPAKLSIASGAGQGSVSTAGLAKNVRRLVPSGEENMSVSVPGSPEMPDDLTVDIPAPSNQNLSLEPLPTLPEELLFPEPTPEPPKVEPLPQPERTRLAPDIGWIPAPKAPQRPKPEIRKITPPEPPRDYRYNPAPRRSMPTPMPTPAQRRSTPPPQRPAFKQPPVKSIEGKAPLKKMDQVAQVPEPGLSPQPMATPKALATPMPLNEPKVAEAIPKPIPPPLKAPGEPKAIEPAPSPEPKAMVKAEPRVPRGLRSFPIIRRFWWEAPLVTPSTEGNLIQEDRLGQALQRPSSSVPQIVEAQPKVDLPVSPMTTPPTLPEPISPNLPSQPSPPLSQGIPPTPAPFDPDAARSRSIAETRPAPNFPEEETAKMEPFGRPQPSLLPTEVEGQPRLDVDESQFQTVEKSAPQGASTGSDFGVDETLLPGIPGSAKSSDAPLFVEGTGSSLQKMPEPIGEVSTQKPSTSVEEPATPAAAIKSAQPSVAAGARTVNLPPLKPVLVGTVQLFDENGKEVTGPVTVLDLKPVSSSRLEVEGRSYQGSFQVYAPTADSAVLVNVVDVEDYVASMVPQEIPPESPSEVLKAQAVLSRCYCLLLAQRGDYSQLGYDIPGDPDSAWPYYGREVETPNTRLAVQETAGEVLVDPNGQVATPVYHFASGGYVADAETIWANTGEPIPPYLKAKPDFDPNTINFDVPADGFATDENALENWLRTIPDTYDKESAGQYFRWTRNLSQEEIDDLINRHWNNQVGKVKSIRITRRAISGHAVEMVVEGEDQTVTARDSDAIREALQVDSSLIVIKKRWGGAWTINGGGLGHGVGLSQCGAIGLATKRQATYRQILNYYFENLKLGKRVVTRSGAGA